MAKDLLYEHVVTEFQIHDYMILEEHGSIPNITEYVHAFINNAVIPLYMKMMKNGDTVCSERFDKDIFKNIENSFFTNIGLEITVSNQSKKTRYSGGYQPRRSIYTDRVRMPEIRITVDSENLTDLLNAFRFVFAHELTHAYDDCQRTMKYGTIVSKMDTDAKNNNYYNTVNYKGLSDLSDAICDILNRLNKIELNAFVGQFKTELLAYDNKIKDINTVYDSAKKTDAWRKYGYLKRNLDRLGSITDKGLQKAALKIYNEVTETHLDTYMAMLKKLNSRFYNWEKTFINRTSKIIYDVYLEINQRIP